jgi:multicomponent K+:H+ antiporter subunit G
MTELSLPGWVAVPAALLLIVAGLAAVIGAWGLVRMPDFFSRMHPPTMGTTLGCGGVLLASMLIGAVLQRRLVVHELLIALFIVLSTPVAAMLLTRAAAARIQARRKQ